MVTTCPHVSFLFFLGTQQHGGARQSLQADRRLNRNHCFHSSCSVLPQGGIVVVLQTPMAQGVGTAHEWGLQGGPYGVVAGQHVSWHGRSAGLCCFARHCEGTLCALNLHIIRASQNISCHISQPHREPMCTGVTTSMSGVCARCGLWLALQEVQLDFSLQVPLPHIYGRGKERGLKWISQSEVREECHKEENERISGITSLEMTTLKQVMTMPRRHAKAVHVVVWALN